MEDDGRTLRGSNRYLDYHGSGPASERSKSMFESSGNAGDSFGLLLPNNSLVFSFLFFCHQTNRQPVEGV